MDHARHQFLAGAGLAFDEHGGVGGRDARGGLVDLHHGRRTADHVALGQFLFVGLVFLLAARRLGALHGFEHAVELERLGDVIERAAAGGRHHRFHGAAGGHEDDRAARILAPRRFQHIQAGAVIDVDIGDDDRIRLLAQAIAAPHPVEDTASTA